LLHSYFHMLAISILYWDHALTLKYEVHYLWIGPKTWSSYWFFLNRYFAFFANITVTVFEFYNLAPQVSSRFGMYRQLVLFIQQVIVCVLLTMRIYALYGRNVKILGYMLGSATILAIVAAWSLFGQKSTTATSGCHHFIDNNISSLDLATAWEALFCYDTILFGFTLYQTYKSRHTMGMSLHIPLVSLMLRDGVSYHAVRLQSLIKLLMIYVLQPFLRGSLSTFASCMSVTMMSRLMLNLHSSARIGIFSTLPTFHRDDSTLPTNTDSFELDTLRTEDLISRRTTRYMTNDLTRLESPPML
ncbi:hypothetical protein C8J55DRAFT_414911, partial [Lentinula edodes]